MPALLRHIKSEMSNEKEKEQIKYFKILNDAVQMMSY